MKKENCFKAVVGQAMPDVKQGKMFLPKHCQVKPDLHKGFTLIELLVVVLIIGILAAVAVPQYQKAVEKSRATEAIQIMRSYYQAGQACYLAKGTSCTMDELAWEYPGVNSDASNGQEYFFTKHFHCRSWGGCKARNARNALDYYIGTSMPPAKFAPRCCFAENNKGKKEEQLCRALFPQGTLTSVGAWWYEHEVCIRAN